ncbi:hypothetical protein QQF54_08960 [Lelliottia sp. V106_10]|nr:MULTISPECIES: hypothetical protein [Enterobacteriaceae]MBM1023129.1 hypothetical protein [Enterobacter sp. E1]MDK9373483.1 hypothetical protein [Lelliottia sp. V106_10]MDK9600476.1 hypothetical protein [Lelliottia sp. V106_5]MEA3564450.1 hypothetical protein [Enterobacter sp. GM-22]MEA3598125.1 hypothetical protein [Enterobacter sp. GM-31]
MILLIWLIGAVIVGMLGKGKGSSFILWFILGVVLDPILAMILLFATK